MSSPLGRLAVIPARGGSKRLPGKNIRRLGDRPLLAWAVTAARESGCFQHLWVSTDCEEIAATARDWGAEVPFLRPPELATDDASSVDVALHALARYDALSTGNPCRTLALIQPTTPFLSAEHIRGAVQRYETGGFTSLDTMCEVQIPPEWMFCVDETRGRAQACHPPLLETTKQQLPRRFRENGALYLVRSRHLRAARSLYDLDNHGAFLMSPLDSVDIDTQDDWDLAEFLLARRCGVAL